MKKVLKSAEPGLLTAYRTANPTNTWEQLKRSDARRNSLSEQLKTDQAGLCAYCEIKLLSRTAQGEADFRVEHFHPKSDQSTAHNWHLDWQNLLGCCHGGSRSDVVDATSRFTSPEHSCDVPKKDKNLDAVILNPLLIPAFPPLFLAERSSGKLKVNATNCQTAGVSTANAQNSIDELKLDAQRLNRFRKTLLDDLNLKLRQLSARGLPESDALARLSTMLLSKDSQQHWPAFFTTIRSYLGSAAETHLHQINYNG